MSDEPKEIFSHETSLNYQDFAGKIDDTIAYLKECKKEYQEKYPDNNGIEIRLGYDFDNRACVNLYVRRMEDEKEVKQRLEETAYWSARNKRKNEEKDAEDKKRLKERHPEWFTVDTINSEKDTTPGCPEETIETAGCTGSCEKIDENDMPVCEECSQGENI